jgi:tetratricopeptide (TPR) repeat protein
MSNASLVIDKAQQLAAAGRYAEVIEHLRDRPQGELEGSPTLALLYGTAQGRLGQHEEGMHWLDVALMQARKLEEQAVERHALNARGALLLVSGRIDEAADSFTQALLVASRDGDFETTGRCSNNLGIINNLRGRHAEAIGSWEIAVAAFDRAGSRQGVAECRHNLAIGYREQGALSRALEEADWAIAEADAAGDRSLWASAVRGRAEILIARGDLNQARRAMDQVRDVRGRLPDPVADAEDRRVAAAVLAAEGQLILAERALLGVLSRPETQARPQILGAATRDLAAVLHRSGRKDEAQAAARAAHAVFARLGAAGEIRALAKQPWDADFAAELRRSLEPLHEAQELADAGRYGELVTYLEGRSQDELESSPMLALLCGIGHSRTGRLDVGKQWALVALSRARVQGDRTLEVRALNVCGAIALERGGIREAAHFFAQAQEEATQLNDMTAVGRCANNLGIIANMQGDFGRAVGAYTRAIAAYEKASYDRGIAESHHNLGITYREQGHLDDAIQAADTAVREARRLGDQRLQAQAIAGRAEIRIAGREPQLALREVERALALDRDLRDDVRETEDLRILAVALAFTGRSEDAAGILRDVITRATAHGRPLLVALAQRDLADIMTREGQTDAAQQMAEAARATFDRLGAKVEREKLDALLGEPAAMRVPPPPVAGQPTQAFGAR